MGDWSAREIHYFALGLFDGRYACYRLAAREAEAEMLASMRQFGQMSPVVCCLREERPRLIDGFRRLWAARKIREIREFSTRLIEVDDRQAKDPNSTGPAIQAILARTGPHLLGAKLLGAGGGGFLRMVCKSPEDAAQVRRMLETDPPNPRARFFRFSASARARGGPY